MIDGYADTNVRRRVVIYWTAGLGLIMGFAAVRGAAWTGDAQLHTAMEAVSTSLALIVGTVAMLQSHARKNNTFLLVGTGPLGAALLDGYHAIVTSAFLDQFMASDAPAAILWCRAASRWFLSVLLFFTFVPLLRAFDPETFFHRPEALPTYSSTCFRPSDKRRMVAAW